MRNITRNPIISLHIPKCAGTSLKESLQKSLGDNLQLDYGDRVLDISEEARIYRIKSKKNSLEKLESIKNKVIIHGHFYGFKYLDIFPESKFVTIIRRPDSLLLSCYHYLLQRKDDNPLIKLAKKSKTFDDFIEIEEFQNIITKVSYPLQPSSFFYIGFFENYKESLGKYSEITKHKLQEFTRNTNNNKTEALSIKTLDRIYYLNQKDFLFYAEACKLFWNTKFNQ